MNREIKFRAWDNEFKEMIHPEDRGVVYIELDGYVRTGAIKGDFSLLQFIGITDRNGRRIYEGDIVKHINMADGNFIHQIIKKYVVEFRHTSFQFVPIEGGNYTIEPFINVEVIGNIYENPELL